MGHDTGGWVGKLGMGHDTGGGVGKLGMGHDTAVGKKRGAEVDKLALFLLNPTKTAGVSQIHLQHCCKEMKEGGG